MRTAFKSHPNDPHTRSYPCLDDRTDCLECTDVEYSPYRFAFDDMDKAVEYLLENGYVVIRNVLNETEIEKGKCLFWDFVSKKSIGWVRNDYKTWNIYRIGGELQNGLIWGKGMGQSQFQWFGRTHPKVLQIFGNIWSHHAFPLNQNTGSLWALDEDTELNEQKTPQVTQLNPHTDLLTSFDGIGLFTPWHWTNQRDKTNSGWYHIDQNVAAKPGIHTIQGYLSYYDQNESTGSTVLIPTTHLKVRKALNLNRRTGDFIRIRKTSKLLDSSLYKKILVCCKAGDMVLWDSRTVHCSSPALLSVDEMRRIHAKQKISKNAGNVSGLSVDLLNDLIDVFDQGEEGGIQADLLRLVSMICMVPKARLSNKNILRNRVQAYIDQCTLSHWPTEYCVLHYPSNIHKNDIKKADDLTKSLIGYA